MKHIGLFEGIGGFSYAAQLMGWQTVAWCEWSPFCQAVLKYHFPEAEGFGDITKTDFTPYAGTIDILTGGFPCQPYSVAGKQLGTEDERHLWPEMLRAIRESRPRWVVGENVGGLINWSDGLVFEQVCADLEAEGYEVQPFVLPACGVNAPHRRDRVWFIAYSVIQRCEEQREQPIGGVTQFVERSGLQPITANPNRVKRWEQLQFGCCYRARSWEELGRSGEKSTSPYPKSKRSAGLRVGEKATHSEYGIIGTNGILANPCRFRWENRLYGGESGPRKTIEFRDSNQELNSWAHFPTQSPLCGRNDGISSRLVGITVSKHRNESIKAYGNAIVPQVATQIFKAIQEYEAL